MATTPVDFVRNQAERILAMLEKKLDSEIALEMITLQLRVAYYQGLRDGVTKVIERNR